MAGAVEPVGPVGASTSTTVISRDIAKRAATELTMTIYAHTSMNEKHETLRKLDDEHLAGEQARLTSRVALGGVAPTLADSSAPRSQRPRAVRRLVGGRR